jgi:1,4-dihydroxy-2-naphthoyl-CoA hydrolase
MAGVLSRAGEGRLVARASREWRQPVELERLDMRDTIMEAIGIEVTELSEERVVATMPVHGPTKQPFGVLHGGASVVLAETVASLGTYNLIDRESQLAMGLEINANHIRAKSEGVVAAVGTPLHTGRKIMVWDVRITDEDDKLICVSRCTVAVVPK